MRRHRKAPSPAFGSEGIMPARPRISRVLGREGLTMPRLAGGASAFVLLVGILGLIMWQPWSSNAEPPPQPQPDQRSGDGFASDRFAAPFTDFDARRAMGHLDDICKIGPRMSGTDGMKEQQDLIEKHFKPLADRLTWQRFEATQKSVHRPVALANLIVSWQPEKTRRVLICSHYDSRPHADQEQDPRRWRQPFVSANDGASGVALLMELARHVKNLHPTVGVDFVLFDGEEYVFDADDEYFLGSKQFAREYRKTRAKERRPTSYVAGVLLDMVGGKGARFPVEQNSWFKASTLVNQVWDIATELNCTAFRKREMSKVAVQDDHIPLNDIGGIPTVDIIDFDYSHWHRITDVPENCSGDSLDQVARVLATWLQRVK
jgi:glutaminyl-peptide cyclotransferase